jgi:AbrB family looped-hinge helix DNA binding protein
MYTIPQPVTVSDKWQVVLPKAVRQRMKIKPKDKVIVKPVSDVEAHIKIIKDPIKDSVGILKKFDKDGQSFKRTLDQKQRDIKYEDRYL